MGYHQYELDIIKEFNKKGYEVSYYLDADHVLLRATRFLTKEIREKAINLYQKNLLNKIKNNYYELIVVIVGRYLTKEFLDNLKKKERDARIILYLWDDIVRVNNFKYVQKCYDVVYSFNPYDAEQYGCIFLPLFYLNNYIMPKTCCKNVNYHLFSAMTDYSDRYEIINRLAELDINIKKNIYLVTGRLKYIQRNFHHKDIKQLKSEGIYFLRDGLSTSEVKKHMKNSLALLDIPFSGQRGLTIRTMEAIGARRKLVTTHKEVERYDFFNNNICIINPENPKIDIDWLEDKYTDLDNKIYLKYSVTSWVESIINGITDIYLK